MLRRIYCLTFVLVAMGGGIPLKAEKLAVLPQVMQPNFIALTDQRLYVVEESSKIHIFARSPKGIVFEKTFGQAGEGPGEFDWIHQIRPLKDHLEIPTSGKFACFTLDGRLINEIKLPISVFKNKIYRAGENYVARDLQIDNEGVTITIRLYNKSFKLIRELGRQRQPGGIFNINPIANYYSACVSGDKIFVVDSGKETTVMVYSKEGVQLERVYLPLTPLKTTAAMKEVILESLKGNPSRWKEIEKRILLPEQTPGLDLFEVVDGRFVARTYHYRENAVEFVIFDLSGKELKRLFLPHTGRLANGRTFCFFQGRYYHLRENLDEETWELHSEKAW